MSSAPGLIARDGALDKLWPPVAVFVLMIILWESLIAAFEIPVYILPSPASIWLAIANNPWPLFGHAQASRCLKPSSASFSAR